VYDCGEWVLQGYRVSQGIEEDARNYNANFLPEKNLRVDIPNNSLAAHIEQ
jgi:hypothetical protein